jgi:hypothetical protein
LWRGVLQWREPEKEGDVIRETAQVRGFLV